MEDQVTVSLTLTLPLLKKGDEGFPVERVQTMLNLWLERAEPGGTPIPLVVDGQFGPKTEQGVKLLQGNNHLRQDGVVGQRTWATLIEQWLTSSGPG